MHQGATISDCLDIERTTGIEREWLRLPLAASSLSSGGRSSKLSGVIGRLKSTLNGHPIFFKAVIPPRPGAANREYKTYCRSDIRGGRHLGLD